MDRQPSDSRGQARRWVLRDTIHRIVMPDAKWFAGLSLTLLTFIVAGCWELDDYSTVKTDWKSGRVVDVVERNREEVEWLSIRTVEGEVWRFTSEGPLPFLPAHFRQHQVLGQTVKIFYITRGELLVAIHATD